MKVGILGGTFDPIHIVHLMVAEQVRESLDLDEIWFMPSRIPPHKKGRAITPASQRLEMVKLAIQGIPYFRSSDFELERPGPSYTVDTVRELLDIYPDYHFYFIIGGDEIDYLPEWHQIDELVEMIQFVGVLRPGYQPENPYAQYVMMVQMPQIDISSTGVRDRVKAGKTVRYMVTEGVRHFIEENKLYGP